MWITNRGWVPVTYIICFITVVQLLSVYPSYVRGKRARSNPMFYLWLIGEELGIAEPNEPSSRGPDERGVWVST